MTIYTALNDYQAHVDERLKQGIPPKALSLVQTESVIAALNTLFSAEAKKYLDLMIYHVSPGVNEMASVKASFLGNIAKEKTVCSSLDPIYATQLLGTMLGGYNVPFLVDLLDDERIAQYAAKALENTLLVFDAFDLIHQKMLNGNPYAYEVIKSWAEAKWFTSYPVVPEKITVTAFRVIGETNTDDLSPGEDAWSRPDIPLHALAMLKNPREGILPNEPGKIGPIHLIESLKKQGYPLAYVGDLVGTGSSRKSATNSMLWHFGQDIPFVPNKRFGGICLANKIAPIFFNTQEDSGVLAIEADVSSIKMGDVLDIYPYRGVIEKAGIVITHFQLKSKVLLDEVRARGRINLIIGKRLSNQACAALHLPNTRIFCMPPVVALNTKKGYTLAQKIVGRSCGLPEGIGVQPGTYCEPHITSVGSQDTTGPMTREELGDLACFRFSADFVMQSFCHTAAYPKPVDRIVHQTLPKFFKERGGVALRLRDGIMHSWLNRFLLPDTVGTGADSHTRFPIGISFPAGSGLVAFAAATGTMPLDMPESILVRFSGTQQPGITLRDLVNAIPFFAIQQGLLTVASQNKKNIFSGKIMEIEGLNHLKVEQAFELSNASAERSAAACTVALDKASIIEYLQSNVTLIRWMIQEGYEDTQALKRRLIAMENWLKYPQLLLADKDAKYAAVIDIDLNQITEPIVACPNDPDNVKVLSSVSGTKIDEVFIGSCMTHMGHYRAASELLKGSQHVPTALWIAPPTKMDAQQLTKENHNKVFSAVGARIEVPGCSLCMGNQAQAKENAVIISTSTRNFPNRLGKNTKVFLASAELAAISAKLGYIPTQEEYQQHIQILQKKNNAIYQTMNFYEIDEYKNASLQS